MSRREESTHDSAEQIKEISPKSADEESQRPTNSKILFALLFAYAEPLPFKKIKDALGWERKAIREAVEALRREIASFPIDVLETASGLLLVTKQDYAPYLKKILKPPFKKLNPKTLETLAIIAYRQPITRMEIERIRGVQVDGSLETLIRAKLAKVTGRKEGLGKPYLYGTTDTFLRFFGIASLRELPKLELDLEKLMAEKIKQAKQESVSSQEEAKEEEKTPLVEN